LQTVTDIRQFTRREVDALLLDVRALSLVLSPFTNLFELTGHLLDGLCECRQLAGDGRYVLSCRHLGRFYAEKADSRGTQRRDRRGQSGNRRQARRPGGMGEVD
jgi:hypothetical protein